MLFNKIKKVVLIFEYLYITFGCEQFPYHYIIYTEYFFFNRYSFKQDVLETRYRIDHLNNITYIYHLPDGNLTMHTAKYQYFLTILYWFRHNYYGGDVVIS